MKKTVSAILILLLLTAALTCGACGGAQKSVRQYAAGQAQRALQLADAYLDGAADAKTTQAALRGLADEAAKDVSEDPLKKQIEKDVAAETEFTLYESRLQLLLSKLNHYLLLQAGVESGYYSVNDPAGAEAAHKEDFLNARNDFAAAYGFAAKQP